MYITEQKMDLNPSFPFSVSMIELKKTECGKERFHWHDCLEITSIHSGKANYYIGGKMFRMDEGDLIIFNNAEPHAWEIVGNGSMVAMVMVFSSDFIAERSSLFDSNYLKPFIERGANFQNRLPAGDEITHKITALIEETYREYRSRGVGYDLMIKAVTLQILTLLIRYYQRDEKQTDTLSERRKNLVRIECALEYIRSNYSSDISLYDAARAACMSPNYFSAFFKKTTGETFVEYLTRLRVYQANRLIRTTDETVLDIAGRCGFGNMSNFYRMYKRVLGESPSVTRGKNSRGG